MARTAPRRTPDEGQLAMTLPMLAERPGSQLDLIAEAGTEVIGPRTIEVGDPAALALF